MRLAATASSKPNDRGTSPAWACSRYNTRKLFSLGTLSVRNLPINQHACTTSFPASVPPGSSWNTVLVICSFQALSTNPAWTRGSERYHARRVRWCKFGPLTCQMQNRINWIKTRSPPRLRVCSIASRVLDLIQSHRETLGASRSANPP
jgi:hypothetical protein